MIHPVTQPELLEDMRRLLAPLARPPSPVQGRQLDVIELMPEDTDGREPTQDTGFDSIDGNDGIQPDLWDELDAAYEVETG